MPTQQENEGLNQAGENLKGPETPEQAAMRQARAAQDEKDADAEIKARVALGEAERGGEAEAPVAESAEKDQEARAREIAQRYLETIPPEDRKLTDTKQVDMLLWAFTESHNKGSHLFMTVDKLGNMPARAYQCFSKGDVKGTAQAWRDFVADPVDIAKETDKVGSIAKSSLPESVRTALLSILLKEGAHSAVDMAKDTAEVLEQSNDFEALKQIREKYSTPEARKETSFRQGTARELLKGLYPDLIESDECAFLAAVEGMDYEQFSDRSAVISKVEQYNTLFGDLLFSEKYRGLGGAANGMEVLAKLKDGGITDREVPRVLGSLTRELQKVIAKKAVPAEAE